MRSRPLLRPWIWMCTAHWMSDIHRVRCAWSCTIPLQEAVGQRTLLRAQRRIVLERDDKFSLPSSQPKGKVVPPKSVRRAPFSRWMISPHTARRLRFRVGCVSANLDESSRILSKLDIGVWEKGVVGIGLHTGAATRKVGT